jgi:hypothetical protein
MLALEVFCMVLVQLNLFEKEETSDVEQLRELMDELKLSSDKVRKGVYAKLNELTKECRDLRVRLELLERHICKGVY